MTLARLSGRVAGVPWALGWRGRRDRAGLLVRGRLARDDATAGGSSWRPPARWGEPLLVTEPDARGGRLNGTRTAWHVLTPGERRRLIAPGGGTCLLAAKAGGGAFTAWPSVFTRTSTPSM